MAIHAGHLDFPGTLCRNGLANCAFTLQVAAGAQRVDLTRRRAAPDPPVRWRGRSGRRRRRPCLSCGCSECARSASLVFRWQLRQILSVCSATSFSGLRILRRIRGAGMFRACAMAGFAAVLPSSLREHPFRRTCVRSCGSCSRCLHGRSGRFRNPAILVAELFRGRAGRLPGSHGEQTKLRRHSPGAAVQTRDLVLRMHRADRKLGSGSVADSAALSQRIGVGQRMGGHGVSAWQPVQAEVMPAPD